MKTNAQKIIPFGLIAMLLATMAINGCAPAATPSDHLGEKGFSLTRDSKDKSLLWWEKSGFSWHRYHKLMIDPVIADLDDESRGKIDPKDLDAFIKEVTAAVARKLGPEYPVVAEKGPEVLRIRAAITGIESASPVLNLATTLAVFVPMDMGGAAIEAEFFDSLTGERVAAMADRKTGTPFQFREGFSRLGHARAAFELWAEDLKKALATNP